MAGQCAAERGVTDVPPRDTRESISTMNHRRSILGATLTLAFVVGLASLAGCAPSTDKPLPEVEGLAVERGPYAPQNNELGDTLIVSWTPSRDSRVEGYVIYRAEQGIGADMAEKSEFELQAVTIATQYVDDEVHTTILYPTVRYFYQVAVIGAESAQGPLSPEVSIEYTTTG